MKNVLVTGGAGFVGSNITRFLSTEYGCKVTVIDDFFTGDKNNLTGIEAEVVNGSILDEELLARCMKGKDTVFHLAARNIIASSNNPLDDMATNIRGTYNVLQHARLAGIEKMVYTSTCSVYGNSKYLPINEDDAPGFLNFYSVSKYAGEGYAKTFYEQYNFPVTIVRYSNVFGMNQSPSNPYCGVVGKFIHNALHHEPLLIHGDGGQTRDFTFIDDACKATIIAAIDQRSTGDIFNIATGREISVVELAELIIKLTGSTSEIKHIDRRDIDNIRRRVLNVEKIRYKLKFFPQCSLNEGLMRTIEWYKNSLKFKV